MLAVFPVVLVVSTALKDPADVRVNPFGLFSSFSTENVTTAWTVGGFSDYLLTQGIGNMVEEGAGGAIAAVDQPLAEIAHPAGQGHADQGHAQVRRAAQQVSRQHAETAAVGGNGVLERDARHAAHAQARLGDRLAGLRGANHPLFAHAGGQRVLDHGPAHGVRRVGEDLPVLHTGDGALAVDRVAQAADDPPQQSRPDPHRQRLAGAEHPRRIVHAGEPAERREHGASLAEADHLGALDAAPARVLQLAEFTHAHVEAAGPDQRADHFEHLAGTGQHRLVLEFVLEGSGKTQQVGHSATPVGARWLIVKPLWQPGAGRAPGGAAAAGGDAADVGRCVPAAH